MRAYVNTKSKRQDGRYDCHKTVEVPMKMVTQPWKGRTISGYGSQLPTRYMVFYNHRWQRVKVACFANAGTAFIGKKLSVELTIDIQHEDT